MARTLIYVAAGVILGLVVHLVIILTLPRIAQNSAYLQVASIGLNTTTLIAFRQYSTAELDASHDDFVG